MGVLRFTTQQNQEIERNDGDPLSRYVRRPPAALCQGLTQNNQGHTEISPRPRPTLGTPRLEPLWSPTMDANTSKTERRGLQCPGIYEGWPQLSEPLHDAVKTRPAARIRLPPTAKPSCHPAAPTRLCEVAHVFQPAPFPSFASQTLLVHSSTCHPTVNRSLSCGNASPILRTLLRFAPRTGVIPISALWCPC